MEKALLSVVVISHNQKEVLRRCLDSILSQKTNFPVQVIVSDDRSSDGTRDMLLNDYKDSVISTFFDSDTIQTTYTLERAAYNRINGLKLATGKYLIHTDGDDFFTSTDLFQVMVDKLEAHPECNLCCQNYCIVSENDLNGPHTPFNKSKHFVLESILTAKEFMSEVGPVVNACVCARRSDHVKVSELTGNTYDDNDITIRYLENSSVAMINRCDFVYVQYDKSSCTSMTEVEKMFLFNGILHIQLAPYLAGVLLKMNLGSIRTISKYVALRKDIPDRVIKFSRTFDIFLYNGLSNKFSLRIWWRYCRVLILTYLIRITHLTKFSCIIPNRCLYRELYKLAIKDTLSADVDF